LVFEASGEQCDPQAADIVGAIVVVEMKRLCQPNAARRLAIRGRIGLSPRSVGSSATT
jgi:hypothetical protein